MRVSVLLRFWRRPVAFALAGAFLALSLAYRDGHAAALPAEVSGRALVIDGDTIEIDRTRIRLEGIDAPESSQTCGRRWFGTWACGLAAAQELQSLLDGRQVTCDSQGQDRYGRMIGLCSAGGEDINQAMVKAGFAWAFVKYSTRYVSAEADAKAAGAGIWQGEAEPAWVFREKQWASAEGEAPAGCAIKGNITSNGQIYHMPWGSWYGKVKVEPAKGEHWFCSEGEAQAAGFRPAMSH